MTHGVPNTDWDRCCKPIKAAIKVTIKVTMKAAMKAGMYMRNLWIFWIIGGMTWVVQAQAQTPCQTPCQTAEQNVAAHFCGGKQKTEAKTEISWRLMLHSLDWGIRLARDLLLHESALSLSSVENRSRVQWNARGIAQFCKAYQFYIDRLSQHFPAYQGFWASWKGRIDQLKSVAETLQQDALEGKEDRNWRPLRQSLRSWPTLSFRGSAKSFSKKEQEVVWGNISGLSTGIEFTGFHALSFLYQKTLLSPPPSQPSKGLIQFLQDISAYRNSFRELRAVQPKATWIPLFVYHAELFFRATVFLGRSVSNKPKQRSTYQSRYQRYSKTLEQSLKKENSSFADFWRK